MVTNPNDLIPYMVAALGVAIVLGIWSAVGFFQDIWDDDSEAGARVGKVTGLAAAVFALVGIGLFIWGATWDASLPKVTTCQFESDGAWHCNTVYKTD